jgi:hypothetical protein
MTQIVSRKNAKLKKPCKNEVFHPKMDKQTKLTKSVENRPPTPQIAPKMANPNLEKKFTKKFLIFISPNL